ncbi:MAG: hypothetical protein ACXVNF_00995 [Neobacillus sp.]
MSIFDTIDTDIWHREFPWKKVDMTGNHQIAVIESEWLVDRKGSGADFRE